MLHAFALGIQALGIDISTPLSISAIVLAFASVASILLPPSYGAGPLAAILFVFSLFGISETDALAYGTLWWLISQVPAALTGVPSFWLLKSPETKGLHHE